jgi:hypothetical protein
MDYDNYIETLMESGCTLQEATEFAEDRERSERQERDRCNGDCE